MKTDIVDCKKRKHNLQKSHLLQTILNDGFINNNINWPENGILF